MALEGRDKTGGLKPERAAPASTSPTSTNDASTADRDGEAATPPKEVQEIGGPKGPEPTRFGDWEKGGRCSDF